MQGILIPSSGSGLVACCGSKISTDLGAVSHLSTCEAHLVTHGLTYLRLFLHTSFRAR
jgi:hypothetical protein